MTVNCEESGIVFDFLLNLEAVYYAWDLSYPPTYQLAAFIQVHVLQDNRETTFKSSAFTKLEKMLKLLK